MKWLKGIALGFISLILVLLVAVWVGSPFVARSVINSALTDYGVKLTANSSIRLNPFNSSVRIKNMAITADGDTGFSLNTLELHYNLLRLFFSEVRIQKVRIEGITLQGNLVNDELIVAGINLSALSTRSELSSDEAASTKETASTSANFRFSAPDIELTNANIQFQYEALKNEIFIHQLAIEHSRFNAGNAHSEVTADLAVNGAELSVSSQLDLAQNDLSVALDLELKKLDFETYQPLLTDLIQEVSGELSVNLNMAAEISGQRMAFTHSKLAVELTDVSLKHSQANVILGQLQIEANDVNAELALPENITASATVLTDMNNLVVTAPESSDRLVALNTLRVSPTVLSYNAQGMAANIPHFEVTDFSFSDIAENSDIDLPALLKIGQVSINQVNFSENQLTIRDIGIGSLITNLVLDNSGLVNLMAIGTDTAEPAEQTATIDTQVTSNTEHNKSTAPEEAIKFRIDLIEATEPWKIAIDDDTQSPPFAKQFELESLSVQTIDNINTDQPLQINLAAKDDAYFRLNLSSQLILFKEMLSGHFTADIREFSLAEVSPYLESTLDLTLKAGQLDTDISGEINENQLNSTIDITLRGADFSAADTKPEESNLIGQTAIPLNVALNMLKDGNGNINLKVPVDGDIHDPEFGMRYILGLVAKKAALAQAKNYLITAFVPYAQVVKVSMVAGSYALKVRFEALPYEPGQIELSDSQRNFANQLKQLLIDKPKLLVQICPIAAFSEATPMQPETQQIAILTDIANNRAAAFKRSILESSAIESSRLLICAPSIDREADATPRLEFKTE